MRNHIIHFLVRHAKHDKGGDHPATSQPVNGMPVEVNFNEESCVPH
jgi:hypothetical protein